MEIIQTLSCSHIFLTSPSRFLEALKGDLKFPCLMFSMFKINVLFPTHSFSISSASIFSHPWQPSPNQAKQALLTTQTKLWMKKGYSPVSGKKKARVRHTNTGDYSFRIQVTEKAGYPFSTKTAASERMQQSMAAIRTLSPCTCASQSLPNRSWHLFTEMDVSCFTSEGHNRTLLFDRARQSFFENFIPISRVLVKVEQYRFCSAVENWFKRAMTGDVVPCVTSADLNIYSTTKVYDFRNS